MSALPAITSPLGLVLSRLDGVEGRSGAWMARCPVHDDRRASLSVSEGRNGGVLLYCHARCETDAIVAALGLTMRDLMPSDRPALRVERSDIKEVYDYVDEAGALLFQVCRKWTKDGFPQRQPDPARPGDWIWNTKGVRKVVYHLPQLLVGLEAKRMIFVVEGEKDVHTLEAMGLVATTNPGGALKWRAEFAPLFAGARVTILPDNDEKGRAHADQVARSLGPVVAELKVVPLPDLGEKGDVSDWVAAGGTLPQLRALVDAAPRWRPGQTLSGSPTTTTTPPTPPAPPAPPAAEPEGDERFTDLGNARRLVRLHGGDLRHVSTWGWATWDGTHWRRDDTGEAERRAKATVRTMYAEAGALESPAERRALGAWAQKCEDASRLAKMVALAKTEPEIACRPDQFDADPMLFNVENGTLDLRTGALRPHDRRDFITRCAPVRYDAAATCPRFLAFLDRIFAGNTRLIAFVQRAVGYTLTGSTGEHVVFFWIGTGANGKSVLLEVLRELLGPYAAQTGFDAFLDRKGGDGPRNDLARLAGARLVSASESDEGKRLAEGTVKQLSGGDTITARFLHQEFFEYRPQFKVVLVSNHKPRITGTDEGIWRRIRLVPFTVTIPAAERDPQLKATLVAELPGILNWALEGCRAWQVERLGNPDEVHAATAQYRAESDDLAEFFDLHCELAPEYAAPAADLYERYAAWAGKGAVTVTRFGRMLTDRGFVGDKRGTGRDRRMWRVGLRLSDGAPSPREGSEAGTVRDSSAGNSLLYPSHETNYPHNSPRLSQPSLSSSLFGIREDREEEEVVKREAVSTEEESF